MNDFLFEIPELAAEVMDIDLSELEEEMSEHHNFSMEQYLNSNIDY
jgi:hypothetical protein